MLFLKQLTESDLSAEGFSLLRFFALVLGGSCFNKIYTWIKGSTVIWYALSIGRLLSVGPGPGLLPNCHVDVVSEKLSLIGNPSTGDTTALLLPPLSSPSLEFP